MDPSKYNIYKIKIDGTNNKLVSGKRADWLQVVGDWIYYIDRDDERIYRTNLEGENTVRINDHFSQHLNVSKDGWTYYVNSENHSIYRIRIDGTQRQQLTDIPAEKINIAHNWIYYGDPISKQWYKVRIDGTDWGEWK